LFAATPWYGIHSSLHGCLQLATSLPWYVSFVPRTIRARSHLLAQTSVIQTHISNVAGHFKGKLYGTPDPFFSHFSHLTWPRLAWDVVNEMFNDDSNGSVRSSVFSNVLGTDFVRIAFQAARAADSNAKLYINDYNLEYNAGKRNSLLNLVKSLNSQYPGLIDGIGTQTHLSAGGGSSVAAAVSALAAANVDVAITELDIRGASNSDYTAVVNACLNNARCVSITSWGVSDKDSWIQGVSGGVLLYDSNFQPKGAYNAVMSAL
jgi:endo-1,4-beta-xylanase